MSIVFLILSCTEFRQESKFVKIIKCDTSSLHYYDYFIGFDTLTKEKLSIIIDRSCSASTIVDANNLLKIYQLRLVKTAEIYFHDESTNQKMLWVQARIILEDDTIIDVYNSKYPYTIEDCAEKDPLPIDYEDLDN